MKSILIVDDEFYIKQSLSKIIERMELPFKVIGCVENGLEALEVINDTPPALLITDINMPIMDGFELIKEIKMRKLSMDIIILSGYDDFEYVQSAIQYHVYDYWLKPIKIDKVHDTLIKLQGEWELREYESRSRSNTLPRLIMIAQQLIEQVWRLHHEGIQQQLMAFNLLIQEAVQQHSNISLAQIYYDFIVLLDEEMINISNQQLDFKFALDKHWSGAQEDLYHNLQQSIAYLCETIRQNRNLGYSKIINQAIDYLSTHYQDYNLNLPSLANHYNMSPAYFSRLFKSATGMTFSQYLIEYRLKKAKELLTQPSIKAIDVCYNVGYQDYPHFAKAFKKKYNVSPTEFKKTIS